MHPLATYYDLQILMLLVASGASYFLIRRDRRYRPLSLAAAFPKTSTAIEFAAALAFVLVLYGSFVEPQLITVTTAAVALPPERRLDQPLRLAVVSDFHLGPYKQDGFVRRAVKMIQRQQPDAVLITGDFVYSDDGSGDEIHFEPLRALANSVPVIAVLGNHDTGLGDEFDFIERPDRRREILAALRAVGVTVLVNDRVLFSAGSKKLAVAGLAEFRTGQSSPLDALRGISADVPRIVMTHNPGAVRFLAPGMADLVVAAHTHGGQVRIPFLPPLVRLPTPLGQRYEHGLYDFHGLPLFITRGIGESGPRARLFAPPEIAILTIE